MPRSVSSPAPEFPTLSLCMIVRDEAFFLEGCLAAVDDHVDEIVIVDTGSADATREIAGQYTDKVLEFPWRDDFSAARNYSLEQASGDWILVLDADELIEPGDLQRLRQLTAETDLDAFFLTQYNYTNDNQVPGWLPVRERTAYTGNYRGYRRNPIARLFRNHRDIRYHGKVHEVVDRSLQAGHYVTLDIPIHHHMDEDPAKPRRERQLNYLRIIEPLLDDDEDGRLHSLAASIHMYFLEDYARAAKYLRRAVELGYQREQSQESLAEACYRLGDLDEAYDTYRELYDAGHRSFNLCNNLANLSVKRGEPAFAADLLELALDMGVTDAAVRQRLQHNIRYLREQAG